MDWDLVRSAFHVDAYDDHGFVRGNVDDLLDFISSDAGLSRFDATMHYIGHQVIEVDGDRAKAETYGVIHHVLPESPASGPGLEVIGLRYIDRFEKRDRRWAIAHRVLAFEWASRLPREADAAFFPEFVTRGRRGPGDVVYQ
jgi:hypothetical protein